MLSLSPKAMPRDLESLIRRAVAAGPDMRIPQDKYGYWNAALARFIGYVELGQHDVTRDGVTVQEDRVHLVFEVSAERPEPRNLSTRAFPYFVSATTTLSLLPGACFLETFKRMNFEGTARHMVELLGEPFGLYVRHYRSNAVHATTITTEGGGYVIYPLKDRDARTGNVLEANIAPYQCRPCAFVWNCSDLDDWYDLYRPGKNLYQQKIVSARNWPEHQLCRVAKFGPGPGSND